MEFDVNKQSMKIKRHYCNRPEKYEEDPKQRGIIYNTKNTPKKPLIGLNSKGLKVWEQNTKWSPCSCNCGRWKIWKQNT